MAQTQRTSSEIYTLLADNSSAAISPQDLRDGFATWRPGHGQIHVAAADSAAISITDTTNYFEATTPTWTALSGMHLFDDSGIANGRLTYTGVASVWVHVAATVSFSGAANDVLHWRIGKNTTPDPASEIQRKVSGGGDVGSSAMHLVTQLVQNDYLSLWVRNASATDNPTLDVANLQAVSMPA